MQNTCLKGYVFDLRVSLRRKTQPNESCVTSFSWPELNHREKHHLSSSAAWRYVLAPVYETPPKTGQFSSDVKKYNSTDQWKGQILISPCEVWNIDWISSFVSVGRNPQLGCDVNYLTLLWFKVLTRNVVNTCCIKVTM